ncbi:MAG TPA: ion channel, partial [Actinomycetota bacterium]
MRDWAERRTRPRGSRFRELMSTRSFGLVLLGLAVSYGLSIALSGSPIRKQGASIVIVAQMATVLIALRASQARRVVRGIAFAAMAFAAGAAVLNLFGASKEPSGWVFVAGGLMFLVTPISIVRSIVQSGSVDREVVLGVIDAYLMIGMFFAFSYRALGLLQSGSFFGPGGEGTTAQDLFFSFTTLTTTGYGNLVPAENPGQSFAVLEMLIGQLFLVTALAKIVSAWRPTRWGLSPA